MALDQFTPEIKQLIEVAVIVLIPIIPALILYSVLPSRATVSGPFKGLNIRLQGAFGGYFVLVLVVVAVVVEGRLSEERRLSANLYPKYETWTIEGYVKFPRALEEQSLYSLDILLAPKPGKRVGTLIEAHRQKFKVDLPVRRTGPEDGSYEVPFNLVIFDHPDFQSTHLNLDPEFAERKRRVDEEGKRIIVTDPIELKAKSAMPEGREEVEATAQ